MAFRPSILAYLVLLCLGLALAPQTCVAGGTAGGEQIYRRRCATCHGASGEGTDENYPHQLAGDRSLEKLTRLIARTMPKDAKQKCTPDEAAKVAEYIYNAFYSKDAQARNKPPRIELSRLTVRQYRNAVADLIGSFRPAVRLDGRHGLRGEYFKTGFFRRNAPVLDRLDAQVQFDFGTAAPAAKDFEPNRFSIRWTGSVFAPETGEYEFIARTDHAVRLWVNDNRHPLIDAWVKSGSDTEYRGSILLLGGRYYPLRLEFSKSKQGVDDSQKNPQKPGTIRASITLAWKPPRQAEEPIPARDLASVPVPETLVLAAPFPPDDQSTGYERGNSVSKAWDEAATEAALEAADYISSHLVDLTGAPEKGPERERRLRDFCVHLAERSFRRSLDKEQKQNYIERQFQRAADTDAGLKRAVLAILKSPRFLYRELDPAAGAFDVASRLSFGFWDSIPDQQLFEAAASGKLSSPEQITDQAKRMVGDARTRSKVRNFLLGWLKVDPAPDLAKAKELFPGFDKNIASDLRTSLELFLDDVVWGNSSDFKQLFRADYVYLNGRLAQFYSVPLSANAPFQKVSMASRPSAGILSHPYLMATFAYTSTSSPIHRGVFLARNVLGVSLRPPPEAFAPLPPESHPELTTRERVMLQTRPQQCQSCHSVINPLGFVMENFDAVGRYRALEQGHPINPQGAYEARSGKILKFAGVRDLGEFVATSEESQENFVKQLFHYIVKQPIRAFGSAEQTELCRYFTKHNCSIRNLIVEIITESASVDAKGKVEKVARSQ